MHALFTKTMHTSTWNFTELEILSWEGKAAFILKRALPLKKNLKVYGKHLRGHKVQYQGNRGHELRDLNAILTTIVQANYQTFLFPKIQCLVQKNNNYHPFSNTFLTKGDNVWLFQKTVQPPLCFLKTFFFF